MTASVSLSNSWKIMFRKSENKPTLYIKKKEHDILIIYIYADDIIYMGSSQTLSTDRRHSLFELFQLLHSFVSW